MRYTSVQTVFLIDVCFRADGTLVPIRISTLMAPPSAGRANGNYLFR